LVAIVPGVGKLKITLGHPNCFSPKVAVRSPRKQGYWGHMSGCVEVDFQFLAEHNVDMICMVGLDLIMHYASPSCESILGWTPEEMCGRGPDAFVLPEDLPIVAASQELLMSRGVDERPTIVRMRKKDGSYAWMEINARIMRDITWRKMREEELEQLAFRDGLTGLANRRFFDRALDQEWRRTIREGVAMSLILLDVDCFKEFNDLYGHVSGDACLRAVAEVVRQAIGRSTDLAARYGGEEIAVILPDTNPSGAFNVAESIRAGIMSLQIAHEGNSAEEWVTVSLGVVTATAHMHGTVTHVPEKLLLAADRAMYNAKHKGKNCVHQLPLSQLL
jgi:diguanylate cyclase (GGDEF)-like protein/PAS domain S-box-containing protein